MFADHIIWKLKEKQAAERIKCPSPCWSNAEVEFILSLLDEAIDTLYTCGVEVHRDHENLNLKDYALIKRR